MGKCPYYNDYLQLDKILAAQELESSKSEKAHDEMLFIVIHQTYELWFKQILIEIDSVITILKKPILNDNSAELQTVVHRLQRTVAILRVLVNQMDVMETMTAMDFLDFRDQLNPASGFQSWQFKVLEAKLGLQYNYRHGQEYYVSQLEQPHINLIKEAEMESTILTLVNNWLERMPFFDMNTFWQSYHPLVENQDEHPFWMDYEYMYNLTDTENKHAAFFKTIFTTSNNAQNRQLSPKACRAALFIMLYRGYPMLELPFQLLDTLLEIDNQLGNWRYRHLNMVRRTIGSKIGTGGSTGAGYLKEALDKHYIFNELSQLTSFLVSRKKLPLLPEELTAKLGYNF